MLNFNPPLYTTLDPHFAYNLGTGSVYDDGSGSSNPVTGIVRAAPFEFSTTPGLIAFGLLTGGKYLYDQKKKKKHCPNTEFQLEKTTL